MNKKESLKDTARVLGSMYDAIEFRVRVESFSKINAKFLPTNVLISLPAFLSAFNFAAKSKNFALIFEKDSTRTRCAFEVGAADQGAHTTYLGPTGSQMNKNFMITSYFKLLI